MNWIRMATTMKGDPSVHAIAALCCKGDIPKAIGHLQCLFSELPVHARGGKLAGIDPLTLEHWALWKGKPGALSSAIQTSLCGPDGTLRSWDRYNGAAIREAERNAKKAREYRSRTGNVGGDVPGTVHNDVTERNGTKEEEERAEPPAPSSSAMRQQDLAELERVLAMLPEPKHRDAIRGYALRQPASKLLALSATIEGLGPNGIHAAASTWYQLSRGVMDAILANDGPSVSTNMFRGCIRKAPGEPPKLTLIPKDEPGTVRDEHGKTVWSPGDPPMYQPTLEQIAQNGWSVAA